MTNEQLVIRIKAGIDPAKNMLTLYENNKGLIFKIANKYQAYAELDDLLQEGYIGLCGAVDGYDPEDGSFSNYAFLWIRQAINRYALRNRTVRVPESLARQISGYNKMQNDFMVRYGREATDYEMRRLLGLTIKQYDNLIQGMSVRDLASLDTPLKSDPDGELTIADVIPGGADPGDEVTDRIDNEVIKSFLWGQVGELPEDQKEVIVQHYKDEVPYKAIAESMGLTCNDVRTKASKGIKELRSHKRRKLFRKYLPEWIESDVYKGNGVGRFKCTWTSSTERIAIKLTED